MSEIGLVVGAFHKGALIVGRTDLEVVARIRYNNLVDQGDFIKQALDNLEAKYGCLEFCHDIDEFGRDYGSATPVEKVVYLGRTIGIRKFWS